MYGGYLDTGISGITETGRYIAQDLRSPGRLPFTPTSKEGTIRPLYGIFPQQPTKIYGEFSPQEIEGHQVDPAYDVRGSGLGSVRSIVSGKRAGQTEFPLRDGLSAPPAAEELPPVPVQPDTSPTSFLMLAGLGFALWHFSKRGAFKGMFRENGFMLAD